MVAEKEMRRDKQEPYHGEPSHLVKELGKKDSKKGNI